nr:hypothetical protein CFP56_52276 [Quercus suber]
MICRRSRRAASVNIGPDHARDTERCDGAAITCGRIQYVARDPAIGWLNETSLLGTVFAPHMKGVVAVGFESRYRNAPARADGQPREHEIPG